MRYLDLAADLRDRIAAGEPAPGGALPSEAELGRRTGVSRVTVRRALETLRDEGLVTSRQGAGWFAAGGRVDQALGRFTTVEGALEAAGAHPGRRVLEFAFEPAPHQAAVALGLGTGDEVLRVKRVNLADGEPFGLVTVWVPSALGATLSRAQVERTTFYEVLPLRGVELGGATQTITACAATADDAAHLGVDVGEPMLVARRVTTDAACAPVVVSEHRYPARRTAFEVEFARVGREHAHGPSGVVPIGSSDRVHRRRAYPSTPTPTTGAADG